MPVPAERSAALRRALSHPAVWRGRDVRSTERAHAGVPTGFRALDAALPGGGWPIAALTEILAVHEGIGELELLVPALARLSREGRGIVWIAPPHVPYAPALAGRGVDLSRALWVCARSGRDRLWAAEQALRDGDCGAVLLWPAEESGEGGNRGGIRSAARDAGPAGRVPDARWLRRLQLAAEAGGTLGVLFRAGARACRPSPAALRLALAPGPEGLEVRVIRCRGRAPAAPLRIRFS